MHTFRDFVLLLVVISLSQANFVHRFNKEYEQHTDEFKGKIWVLLVAGSSGYFNYRHQADVCHSYQIIHQHGIPDEQIVVMMYDDIANSPENPTPGIIINHPDGPDVYKGVPKDYTKEDVTPNNFLNILTGNSAAMQGIGSGKVIKSGPNDHVFVYFADHGAPGLIAFPTSELLKDDLNNAIESMYRNSQYKQLLLYVEACESGSMFENVLASNINVYATTAANADESSYACYYDNKRETFLGDVYSVSWLEDSDKENIEKESLHHQYVVVKALTNTSHVMQYGDLSLSTEIVGFFQGEENSRMNQKPLRKIYDGVPSPDVPLHILQNRINAATTQEDRFNLQVQLNKEMEMRRRIEWAAHTIAYHSTQGDRDMLDLAINSKPKLQQLQCYKEAIQEFDAACFELDDYEYAYRQLFVFGNLCDIGLSPTRILASIRTVCH